MVGKNDGKTSAIIKGPLNHPSWVDKTPDSVSHLSDKNFSSAHREPAFFEMSKLFNLDHYVPESTLFRHPVTNSPWSAMKYVPGLERLPPGEEDKLQPIKRSGDLHKIAIMDMVLGNNDRHKGNFMFDRGGKMHLIDNGLAFDYSHSTTGAFPGYAESFKHDQVNEGVHNWLRGLDSAKMVDRLRQLGAPEAIVSTMSSRINQAKDWSNRSKDASQSLNTLDTLSGMQSARRLPDNPPLRRRMEDSIINGKLNFSRADSRDIISDALSQGRRATDRNPKQTKGSEGETVLVPSTIKTTKGF